MRSMAHWVAAMLALCAAPGLTHVARAEGEFPSPGTAPEVRKIFVPADAPAFWPAGNWQPLPLADFERMLETARSTIADPAAASLEQANYEATLSGESCTQGTFVWTIRDAASSSSQAGPSLKTVRLAPLNLPLFDLKWDTANGPVPATWGTDARGTSLLVCDHSSTRLSGGWSLRGRKLARSTDFEFSLPAAVVTRLVLHVPAGVLLSANSGDLSGPHADLAPGWATWRLNLGGHSQCRLRATPAVASPSARPLLIASERTSYFVRPELLRWQVEFEPQVLESQLRTFVLALDEGMQLTAVEYGEDGVVAWKQREAGGRGIVEIRLPEGVQGLGQRLLARGFASAAPSGAWCLPRARLMHAVSTVSDVVVRLQDPFRAADIRADGYRQMEFTVDAADEETLTFRQFRPEASIVLALDRSLPRLTCRTIATIRQAPRGWSFDADLDLHAAAGGCYAASCRLPSSWTITNVRPAADEYSEEAVRWEVRALDSKSHVLSLDFMNAVDPAAPRHIHIQAYCPHLEDSDAMAIPLLDFGEPVDHEMTLFVACPPRRRGTLDQPQHCRTLNLSEISSEIRNAEPVRSLMQASAVRVLAIRATGSNNSGRIAWHDASAVMPVAAFDGSHAMTSSPSRAEIDEIHTADWPVVPLALRAAVRLTGDSGHDRYVVAVDISRHDGEASLSWSLDEACELIQVAVDGQPRRAETDGLRSTVALGTPRRASSDGGPGLGRLQEVEIEYRTLSPAGSRSGRRVLHFPHFDRAPLHYNLRLIASENLLLSAADSSVSLAQVESDGSPVDGSMTPVADARVFNPFVRDNWRRLAGFFLQSATGTAAGAGDVDESPAMVAGEQFQRREASAIPVASTVWHASGAVFPEMLELQLVDVTSRRAWGWSACALACIAVVVARGRVPRISRYGAALTIATIGIAAIAWGSRPGDMAASALTGALVGVLLPTRWLLPRRSQSAAATHLGSTPALSSAMAGSVLIAALPGLALEAAGQQLADSERPIIQSTPAALPRKTPIDILVPTDGTGDLDASPVVYVSADNLAQLRRQLQDARSPAYLVRSARVVGRVADQKRLSVSIAYDVAVLSENTPVQVEFPGAGLVLAGDSPCLIDGQPSPVYRSSDGQGIVVELASGNPLETGAAPPSPPRHATQPISAPAAGRERYRSHRIEFEARALVEEAEPSVFAATVGVLVVDDAVASLVGAPAGAIVPVSTALQAGCPLPASEAADTVGVRFSRCSAVQFRWRTDRQAPRTPAAEALASTTALVDIGSESTRLSWRVDYRVVAGQIDALHWTLPAGWSVQSLYSSQMAGYVVEAGDAGSRRLVVELAEPMTKTVSIEASFVQPVQQDAKAEMLVALPEVAALPSDGVHIAVENCRVGFRHSPQYRLDVAAADPATTLRACSVDDFAADWFADGPRPQQAFDLARPGPLRLALESLPATLVARCESRARCSLDQIDWVFLAEIEKPQAPRFQFRLRVDPRLRIRNVSVLEDGAERVWRWSHSADSLVVFLTDRVARAVTLQVDAKLPLAAPGDIVLPFIELDAVQTDGAEPAGQSLFLESAADSTVALVDAAGRNAAELFAESPSAQASPMGAFRLAPDLPPLHLRVAAARHPVAVETYSCFLDGPAGPQIRTMVEYDAQKAAATGFELRLAPALAERALFVAPRPAEVIERSRSEESVVLAFYALEPVVEPFRIFIVTPAEAASSGMRAIPAFDFPGAAVVRHNLLLPPGAVAATSSGQALDQAADRWPGWLADWPTLAPGHENGTLVELPANARSLEIRSAAEKTQAGEIPLVGVTLEMAADGSLAGRLLALLPASAVQRPIEFAWPLSTQPLEAFVDGYSIGTPVIDNGVWRPPLPASGSPGMLSIAWTSPAGSLTTIGGRLQEACPWPVQTPVAETFLALRWPAGLWGWHSARSRSAAADTTTVAEEIAALRNRLTNWGAGPSEAAPKSPLANAPLEQFALTFLALDLQQAPSRPTSAFRLSNDDPHGQPLASIEPGLFLPRSYLRYALALSAIAFVLAAGRRVAGFLARLQDHRAAALFALGLTWWLLLAPSALGLAIVLLAGIDAGLARRRKQAAAAG